MRTDRALGLAHLAAAGLDGGRCLVEPSLRVEVDQKTMAGGPMIVLLGREQTAADIALGAGQETDREFRVFVFLEFRSQ
jgi:hypothetical protein